MKKILPIFYYSITFTAVLLLFAFNSISLNNNNSDAIKTTVTKRNIVSNLKNKNDVVEDDTIYDKNCSCEIINKLINAKPTINSKRYTHQARVYEMIMNGSNFKTAYNELQSGNYDYVKILYSSNTSNPFYLLADGFVCQSPSQNRPTPIKLKQTAKYYSFNSTSDIKDSRWWIRSGVICEAGIKEFIDSLKNEGIDFLNNPNKYNIVITPYLTSDIYCKYIGLVLSLQTIDAKKTYTTHLNANPCPKCKESF